VHTSVQLNGRTEDPRARIACQCDFLETGHPRRGNVLRVGGGVRGDKETETRGKATEPPNGNPSGLVRESGSSLRLVHVQNLVCRQAH
jgi:hypothetical protein